MTRNSVKRLSLTFCLQQRHRQIWPSLYIDTHCALEQCYYALRVIGWRKKKKRNSFLKRDKWRKVTEFAHGFARFFEARLDNLTWRRSDGLIRKMHFVALF